jgi:hypothetical protein
MNKRHTVHLNAENYAKLSKMAAQDQRNIASMLSVLINGGIQPAAHPAQPNISPDKPKPKDQGQDTWFPKTHWRTGKPISGFSKEYGVLLPWGVEKADMTVEQRNPNRIKPYEEWVEIAQQWPESRETVYTPDGVEWRISQGYINKPTRLNEDGVAYLHDQAMEQPCMTCAEIREAHRNGTLELDHQGYFHYRLDEFREGFYDADIGYFSVSDGT